MTEPRPTVKDIARAVAQLNEQQDEESLERVARNMAYTLGRSVLLRKVAKRDAGIMLATAGADDFVIDKYAGPLAGRLRAHADQYGRLSASI